MVDLRNKEPSCIAEHNEDIEEKFVEIISYHLGYKKGRSTVRKNSFNATDSPRKIYRMLDSANS